MQCISSFNKNSPLLTFNICIYSRLRLHVNSITIFSSGRREALEFPPGATCQDVLNHLKDFNCFNGNKHKDDQTSLNFLVLLLLFATITFKCNILFGFVCAENTRKRLKASKNDWIQACMWFWTLPILTGYKLKFSLHTHAHGMQLPMNTENCVLKL